MNGGSFSKWVLGYDKPWKKQPFPHYHYYVHIGLLFQSCHTKKKEVHHLSLWSCKKKRREKTGYYVLYYRVRKIKTYLCNMAWLDIANNNLVNFMGKNVWLCNIQICLLSSVFYEFILNSNYQNFEFFRIPSMNSY